MERERERRERSKVDIRGDAVLSWYPVSRSPGWDAV
jgi:hypothetical protein